MPRPALIFSPSEPDPVVFDHVAAAERVTLAAVITLVAVNFAGSLIPFLGRMFTHDWRLISTESAFIILFTALSLYLSTPRYSRLLRRLGLLLAVLIVLTSMALFVAHLPRLLPRLLSRLPARIPVARGRLFSAPKVMSPQSAAGFALLGLAMIFIRARKRLASYAADLLTACTVFLLLTLVSAHFLGTLHIFALRVHTGTSSQTMLCLLLLTGVVFFRRAENGVFSILLGHGVGSRIARILFPVLLALPYLREALRARLINVHRMPPHAITALLATLAAAVSITLLLFIAWYVNRQEVDIRDLSLRDALTGLHNLRGFRLLAEQALRLAHRSGLPFSVLFIDLDNLKQSNDSFGHQTGSELLVETAKILQNAFRETDVLGRIGGDEFAVAGQFSAAAIDRAALRLTESSLQRNAWTGRRITLTFSSGYATSEATQRESLDELLLRADQAMYEEKRRKKNPVA